MLPQKGQILLIVVLVIIVVSTIGLSLVSRSIISIKTSTEEAESQKALAAAEAGIERAVQGSIPIELEGNNPGNSSYSTELEEIQSSTFLVNGGSFIPKDEGADIWFVERFADGSPNYSTALSPQFLQLYWGSPSEACGTSNPPAALEVVVVSRNTSAPNEIKSYRYAYDKCDRDNNFTSTQTPNPGIPNLGIDFTITTPNDNLAKNVANVVLMRVIPLYKDAIIGFSACDNLGSNCTALPSQGYLITSTGVSGSVNRKISVFKGYPQIYLPYISYGVFVAK